MTTYKTIEYLESTGTQYIDSLVTATNEIRVTAEFQITEVPSSWAFIFGGRIGYHNADYSFAVINNRWHTGFANESTEPTTPSINVTTKYVIDKNRNVLTNNGVVTTNTNTSFSNDKNIVIFACNNNGTVNSYSKIRLYNFKMYKKDVLIRDYVPIKDENNVACLFDKVTKIKFYNKGSGTFTAGAENGTIEYDTENVFLPKGISISKQVNYKVLDYIESTGTQWIDTNITANQDTNMELDFQYIGNTSNATAYICGVRDLGGGSSYNNAYGFFVNYSNYNSAFNYYPTDTGWITNTPANVRCTLKNIKNQFYYNGTLKYTASTSTFNSTNTIKLCAMNNGDGTFKTGAKIKIYSYKITKDNVLVRDFVPVKTEANEVCLFEKVNKTLFHNQGTGSFVAGTETGETITSTIVPIKKMYFGKTSLAKKVKKVYVGVNNKSVLLYSSEKITPFTANPAPTSWTQVTKGTKYTATNSYGTWTISAPDYNSYTLNNGFDGISTGSTYYLSASKNNANKTTDVILELPSGVSIQSTSIELTHKYCGTSSNYSKILGLNEATNTYEQITTIAIRSSRTTETYTDNSGKYYKAFKITLSRYSAGEPAQFIYNFAITKGNIKVS